MNSSLGLFVLNTVLMPGAVLRLHVFEDRYKVLMGQCIERKVPFGVLLCRNGNEIGDDLDPVHIGTTAVIRQVSKLSAGRLYVIASGVRRFKVERVIEKIPFWRAEVAYLHESCSHKRASVFRDLALEGFRDYLEVLLPGCDSQLQAIELPVDVAASSYIIADALQIDVRVKQMLLEVENPTERLRIELALLEEETKRLRALRSRRQPDDSGAQLTPLNARFSRN
jgi:uncharacterized protein